MYLPSLPGSADFQKGTSLQQIIEYTHSELVELEKGGVDGVVIGNQQDWPYQVGVGPETSAIITKVLTESMQGLQIPIGITIFWDDLAAIAIAKAVGARFVRGVFRGVYAGEMGLMSLNAADAICYRKKIDAEEIKLMFMLRPILCKSISERGLLAEIKDAQWSSKPDAFALCGPIPGESPTLEELKTAKQACQSCPLITNNGATPENIGEILAVCDGAVVATHLRKDKKASNPFDHQKVREFMDIVEKYR